MFCNYCGSQNPDEALYCSRCGRKTHLPVSVPAESAGSVAPIIEDTRGLPPSAGKTAEAAPATVIPKRCPVCGLANPGYPNSAAKCECGVDLNEVAQLLDALDPRKLTPAHRALAKEINRNVNENFQRAQEERLIEKEGGEISGRPLVRTRVGSPPSDTVTPEQLARLIAKGAGQSFSRDEFTRFFEGQRLPEGRTLDDALAVWSTLDKLAIVVAGRSLYNDWSKVSRISPLGEALAADSDSFTSCKNGTDLFQFFARYVNRILGKPELLSIGGSSMVYPVDPILVAAVCGQFVGICIATKHLLDKFTVDWNAPSLPIIDPRSVEGLHDLLVSLEAGAEMLEWARDKSLAQAWETCNRADWMLWLCEKMIDSPGWPTLQQVVLAACSCAQTVLGIFEKKYPGGSRLPRTALETARAWASGKANLQELDNAVKAIGPQQFFGLSLAASNAVTAAHDAAAVALPWYPEGCADNAVRSAVLAEAWPLVFTRSKANRKLADLVRRELEIPLLCTRN